MKHLKKAVALLLALLILAAFASCGKKDETKDGGKDADTAADAAADKTGLILNDNAKRYFDDLLADEALRFLVDAKAGLLNAVRDSKAPEYWLNEAAVVGKAFSDNIKPGVEAMLKANEKNEDIEWVVWKGNFNMALARAAYLEFLSLDYNTRDGVTEKDAEDAINTAVSLVKVLTQALYTEESANAFLAELEELL
jgi:hypothetical protein